MATALKSITPIAREVPHTVSPGLWALAWKRLQSDHVGMVSLAIVAAFLVLMMLSGTGSIATRLEPRGRRQLRAAVVHRRRHRGRHAGGAGVPSRAVPVPASEYKSSVVDPLADVLAEIRGEKAAPAAPAGPPTKARRWIRSPT